MIFTSGSTGAPKGVAVSHRSAAAFVDAESRLFLQDEPLGPGDRVMAGLSVAFDASCEEMWLAWRYGACLVPAPRSLVRSGMELGPWLVANDVTVVSTVPTLVALWPADALAAVRLLILGGEACPPELAARLVERRPGGLEHLRPDRGHRRRLRRPAHRRAAGAHRAAARRLGPRRGRRGRRPGRAGRHRRADHRRRRAGPLPRPGEGRGEVRTDALARLGARLPQRRPRPLRAGGPALPRPRRRPGQGRRPAHRARRDRQRAAGAARRDRSRRRGAAYRLRQRRCWSATSRRPGSSTPRPRSRPCGPRCRRRSCPRLAQVDTLPDPHLGQDRPRRAPLAARHRRDGRVDAARGDSRAAAGHLGRDPRRQRSAGPRTTSSTSAVAASPRPSWCRGCARRTPRSPSPTSTTTRASAPSPWRSTSSRHPRRTSTGRSIRCHAVRRPTQVLLTVPLRTITGLRWLTWVALGTHGGGGVVRGRLAAERALGRGARAPGCCWCPPPAACCSPPSARARSSPGWARAPTPVAARCTCACGSPSGSPRSSARPTSPALR